MAMTDKEAIEAGMKIAEDHKFAILEMMRHFPELTTEQALHGNLVWLAAQIMKLVGED